MRPYRSASTLYSGTIPASRFGQVCGKYYCDVLYVALAVGVVWIEYPLVRHTGNNQPYFSSLELLACVADDAFAAAGQIINHGYLAVNFFFVLSGFVIGYAYDDRWDRVTIWSFFKRRVIRLHPMVVYGCAFGALMFYFTGCQDQFPLVDQTPWWMLILVFLWCCTIVPMPASWDIRGWAETNPLNGPVWSLQWEYLANILYALVIRRFTKLWLTVCVVAFRCDDAASLPQCRLAGSVGKPHG